MKCLYLSGLACLFTWACLSAQSPSPTDALSDERGQPGVFIPQTPETYPGEVVNETVLEAPISDSQQAAIIDKLKGLIFVNDVDAISTGGRAENGVLVEGIPELEQKAFLTQMQAFLDKPLTLSDLDAITRETVKFMRAHDRPVVDAIVPEQNISSGSVQVLVLIGKLGKLATENNQYFDSEQLLHQIRLQSGELIEGDKLMSDLRWINQNPFRQTDLVYTQGEEFGETDIILRTKDRFPLRVYGGYENTGTQLTGRDRWFMGFNWGRAFGYDHLLNYQFTANKDVDRLQAHSFSYFIPLEWRHKLWFFGSYSESEASLPAPLALEGQSWRLSTRYIIPLKRWQAVEQEITFGLDWIDSTNNLLFANTLVSNTPTTVVQAVLGYSARRNDAYGYTEFSATARISPGDLGEHNDDDAFQRSRAGTEAQYLYVRADAERATRLPWKTAWVLRGRGQWSSARLISSEQLSFGGSSSVRGYDTNEVNADQGFTMTNELHSPALHPINWFSETKKQDNLVLIAFWDYGYAQTKDTQPGEDNAVFLSSVGPGLRFNYGAYLSATLDWGFQLRDTGVSPSGDSSRVEINMTVSY